jgi:NitT/TauT family transport system ATP-binding protein
MSSFSSDITSHLNQPVLSCQNVCKSFQVNSKEAFTALSNINLRVDVGTFITVLGQSGGGKSSLLKLLGGFMLPTSGEVLFHGIPLRGITPRIGMVFQENTLYPWLTVEQNIGFGFKVRGKSKKHYLPQIQEVMEHVGLYQARHLYPHQLSGGMKQRVSIARSLAIQPDILLLDEPFSALDVQLRRRLQKFLLAIWRETRATMVLVTHDVEEAILLGQKLIIIGDSPGQIIEETDISSEPYRDRYSRAFLDLQHYLEEKIDNTSETQENSYRLASI